MKHQGGVGSWTQRKWLLVRIISWRAQGGQWWLFSTPFPGADCGSVVFIPGCRPWPYTRSELSLSPPLSHRLCPLGPPAQPELGRGQRLHPRVSQELCLPCLDSHCPADLGYITEELLRRLWSWTGARLAAPAAGRRCRSCLIQTGSLGCERGREREHRILLLLAVPEGSSCIPSDSKRLWSCSVECCYSLIVPTWL